MANFNKVILLGNLTRDIELRYSQNGMAIAKFGMAINRRIKVGDEQKEKTCFVDLTAFGRQAEVLNEYVGKGSALFVDGRLEYSTWESQEGGKRSKLEVVVENFQFIGGREGAGGGGGRRGGSSTSSSGSGEGGGGKRGSSGDEEAAAADYDDIPF